MFADVSGVNSSTHGSISASKPAISFQPGASSSTQIGGQWVSAGPSAEGCSSLITNPCSGRVTAIAVDPSDSSANTIYVGAAQGGVWKTTDDGSTWTALLDNPVDSNGNPISRYNLAIGSIAVDRSGTVYVGTGEGGDGCGDCLYGQGILKSTDGGRHWSQLDQSTLSCPGTSFGGSSVTKLAISPSDPNTILAATTSGVFRSADGGLTWGNGSGCWTPTLGGAASDLVIDPANSENVYSASSGEVFKSIDGGGTWAQSTGPRSVSLSSRGGCFSSSGCGRINLAMAASCPTIISVCSTSSTNILAAATQNGNLWTTTDNGGTWSIMNSPHFPGAIPYGVTNFCTEVVGNQCSYDIVVAIDPVAPENIFLGGEDLWVTFDGGTSWGDAGGYDGFSLCGGNIHSDQHAFAFSPADHKKIYVGNDGGIWRTTWHHTDVCGNEFPWTSLNNGLSITQFYSLAAHPQDANSFFGGTQDNGILVYSGVSTVWSQSDYGDGGWTAYDTNNPSRLFATDLTRPLRCCTYPAITSPWSAITNGIPLDSNGFPSDPSCFMSGQCFFPPMAMDSAMPSILFFGTDKLYATQNSGDSWKPPSGTTTPAGNPDFGLDLTTGPTGPGSHWTCAPSGCGTISSIAVAPGVADATKLFVYVGTTNGHFFTSNDGGLSFTQSQGTPTSFPNVSSGSLVRRIAVNTAYPNLVYAAVENRVLLSTDEGASWRPLTSLSSAVESIAVDSSGTGAIYAGTDTGVFVSQDTGSSWQVFGLGLPRVQVMDLVFSIGNADLLAATHGRGVWKIWPTATTVSCSPNSVTVGSATTCTTIVKAGRASPQGPTGTVDYASNGSGSFSLSNSCTLAPIVSSNPLLFFPYSAKCHVTYTATAVGTGSHTITVSYSGDSNYAGSSATTTVNVALATTTTTVSCSPTSATVGSATTCTASLPASATDQPSGSVSFTSDGGGSFNCSGDSGSCSSSNSCILKITFYTNPSPPYGLLWNNACQVTYTPSEVGTATHTITARYEGDSAHEASSGSTTLAVTLAETTTTVSCSLNSVQVSTTTICTADVKDTASGAPTPAGLVSFTSDSSGTLNSSGNCNLKPGAAASAASCSVEYTPTAVGSGTHTITARYSGDSNHAASPGPARASIIVTALQSPSPVSQNPSLQGGLDLMIVALAIVALLIVSGVLIALKRVSAKGRAGRRISGN
jgi:photosystem II stability/assembly factor-like uncharacterized protein